MGSSPFVHREICPGCATAAEAAHTIYRRSYQHPPLLQSLENAYAEVGRLQHTLLEGAEFVLAQCPTCRLVYQVEIPDDSFMHKLYEEWIDPKITFRKHIEESTAASYNRIASEIAALVAKFDRPPYSLKFLDFGMGWGEWVRLARAFGVQAHGAEFSQARLAFARSQALPVVTWDEISTQQFDLIRADQVFEHLAQPLATLQYLARSLKQGGVLKIGVPDGSDIRRRLLIDDWSAPKGSRNSLNAVAPLEHINCFSRNALLAMATKAGLRPVRSRLLLQYTHLILGRTPREILGNLCRPLLRQVLQQSNSILLTHQ
jgi:SAM-dependent methyltransferase